MTEYLRPCYVHERKALFHKWEDKSEIVPPSIMVGGHNGGIVRCTLGIVEYEDGTVHECYPYEIKFVDMPLFDKSIDYNFDIYDDMVKRMNKEVK